MQMTRDKLQTWGGLAALFEALTYVVGFTAMAVWLDPGDTAGWDPTRRLAFVLERQTMFQSAHLMVYVAFGLALAPLTTALHGHLSPGAEKFMRVASPFGYIWAGLVIASGMLASVGLSAVASLQARDPALALVVWQMLSIVQDGLGGGVEVVGGVWVLLLSLVGPRVSVYSPVAWLGMVVGVSGVLTLVPPLRGLGMVFGLTQILWFTAIGVSLLRGSGKTQVDPSLRRSPAGSVPDH